MRGLRLRVRLAKVRLTLFLHYFYDIFKIFTLIFHVYFSFSPPSTGPRVSPAAKENLAKVLLQPAVVATATGDQLREVQ